MARAKKVLTVEARDRAKDKRLQSKYGITFARQNEIRAEQNNQCKTCKVDFTAENPPCTDHFHYKVLAQKLGKKNWQASGMDEGGPLYAISISWEPSKAAAIAAVRRIMNPRSVRGLLCRRCNRGLGYIERFFDAAHHPEHLLPVIAYFQARLTK